MSRNTSKKELTEIIKEWNTVSHKRHAIIENGKDISLMYVTTPCIIDNLNKDKNSIVLDVGCGTGYLTNKISNCCHLCYGIDASEESIRIAKSKYSSSEIKFVCSSISNFEVDFKFDSCVSNMVIMTDPEWKSSLKHIYELLKPEGELLVMLTHPCFWPYYWNYSNENWFDYNKELYIEHDFRTSMSGTIGITTHIHRPLSMYIETLSNIGFNIRKIEEPQPIIGTPKEYKYQYPRFLFIKCVK